MNEIYAIALSWAVTLSGYPMPKDLPTVVSVSHAYLVDNACHGRDCKVMGWFPPGRVIYLDERLDPRESLFASSVLVHEMVHYLQFEAGRHAGGVCESAIRMEYEAYGVQGQYLTRYGEYRPVGLSMHSVSCGKDAVHARH